MLSSLIRSSGLASGLDTQALISSLIDVERNPLRRLEAQRQLITSRRSALEGIESKLDALRAAAEAIDSTSEIGSFSASSSDETIVSATADGTAAVGSYTIEVQALATTRTTQSNTLSADTDVIGSGSIGITVDGTLNTIAIGATDTISEVATAINDADAGVRATVVQVATGDYRLMLESSATGTTDTFVLDDSSFTPSAGFSFIDGADLNTATDATVVFNGLSITRSSNTITDIVDGITFELASANVGTDVTVTVAVDVTELTTKVQTFVDAYNEVASLIEAQRGYDGDGNGNGVLASESILRRLESELRGALTTDTSGTGSTYTSLASIGVTTGADGLLVLNSTDLASAVSDDLDGVLDLFSDSTTGVAANFKTAVDTLVEAGTGVISIRYDSMDTRAYRLDNNITRMEDSLERSEARLVTQFAALESLVAYFQAQGSALSGLL